MKHHFERYCKDYENIENYEAAKKDNFIGWECHHRKEAEISRKELIALGMYWHIPASELIFLTESEHKSLLKGKKLSAETRRKISEAVKGKPKTEEHKRKLSESHKGKYAGEKHPFYGKHHSAEFIQKISEAHKGKHHSAETKNKIAEAARINSTGRHWFNNGKENKFCYECPEGFVPGMLK